MNRRGFLALAGTTAVFPRVALAQQAAKVPRIVVLSNGVTDEQRQEIFRGLADHGYVDGKTMAVQFLTAPVIADVPTYAARAVASRPDLIVTRNSAAPLALKALTTTIPVVMTSLQDPVAIGAVSNYARPGGNMTGFMLGGPDVAGKQIQIIRDILPNLSRLALFGLPADSAYPAVRAQVEAATKALDIETVLFETTEGDPFEPLFAAAVRSGAQALRIVNATYLQSPPNVNTLADLAIRYRLPPFAANATTARNGMLVGYGAIDPIRASMQYVDAILKGASPAELPIMQPNAFEVIVNLKTAKALGITIPQSVLFQATEVIQ